MFEGTQELAENKLLLLYIFSYMECPLTNSCITEVVLENGFVSYFNLQQYLSELVDAGFLNKSKEENRQLYNITLKGKSALEYFESRIDSSKREKIKAYMDNFRSRPESLVQVSAEYNEDSNKQYNVACKLIENNLVLMEMKISTKSIENAKQICSNWKSNASQICSRITKMLME